MHILIAPDSFKGSNSSLEVAKAIQRGIERVSTENSFQLMPVADGGEGTVDALLYAGGGERITTVVKGPLGEEQESFWGKLSNGNAVIEMAAASGLPMVPLAKRNPLYTTTYGTGQLIRQALDAGVRHIMVGLGGSATNDGGMGMAQALGARFLDANGADLGSGGGELAKLASIDLSNLDPRLKEAEIHLACDVSNPLCGEKGASAVYGPQKGADPAMVAQLDENLEHLAKICREQLGTDFGEYPGAGAAGGLGFGLLSFCGAKMASGIETVLEVLDFDKLLSKADLVITGEGRLDGQSVYGKVPVGVAQWAQRQAVPVLAIVGELGPNSQQVFAHGIGGLCPTVDRVMDLDTAMAESRQALEDTAERCFRILQVGQKLSGK